MLSSRLLPETLLMTGLVVLCATAPFPFFFVHSLALAVAVLGALLSASSAARGRQALTLFYVSAALLLWMWLSDLMTVQRPLPPPGPYLFWVGIPLAVSLNVTKRNRSILSTMWDVVTAAALIAGVYGGLSVLIHGFPSIYLPEHTWTFKFREEFARHSGLHPPYFGMFATAALGHLAVKIKRITSGKARLLLSVAFLLLFSMLWLLETRVHLILLITGFLLFLPSWRPAVIVVALILIVTGLLNESHRFREVFTGEKNSATLRLESWRCGLRLFREAPFAGQGQSRIQAKLNNCYGAEERMLQGMNTHNQFMHFAAAGGLPALFLWIAWWGYCALGLGRRGLAFQKLQMYLLFGFCFTENVLERQWGGIMAGIIFAEVLSADEAG